MAQKPKTIPSWVTGLILGLVAVLLLLYSPGDFLIFLIIAGGFIVAEIGGYWRKRKAKPPQQTKRAAPSPASPKAPERKGTFVQSGTTVRRVFVSPKNQPPAPPTPPAQLPPPTPPPAPKPKPLQTPEQRRVRELAARQMFKLDGLTHDRKTSERLVFVIQEKHPDRPLNWCVEKAISDLERDRGR